LTKQQCASVRIKPSTLVSESDMLTSTQSQLQYGIKKFIKYGTSIGN